MEKRIHGIHYAAHKCCGSEECTKDGQMVHLLTVDQQPEWTERAAAWFHEKWQVPEEAYRESMEESIQNPGGVPRWYLVLDNERRIIGGAGIIENDFHARKDLQPNLCALYVEENWRNCGLARRLLDTARRDAGSMGLRRLYLITDHEKLYEKCGWRFLCMVEEGGGSARMYQADTTVLETERLILRPWRNSDAEELYPLARDPEVGPVAGWPVHTSVENSREIIRSVLSEPETFAVVLKETGKPVGSIGLMIGRESSLSMPETEGEIGYWIGKPYWGRGLIPEAVREMQRYGFETLGLEVLWCAHFDGNIKSKQVQEKCGFVYHHTNENVPWPRMKTSYTEHVTRLTKEAWQANR